MYRPRLDTDDSLLARSAPEVVDAAGDSGLERETEEGVDERSRRRRFWIKDKVLFVVVSGYIALASFIKKPWAER